MNYCLDSNIIIDLSHKDNEVVKKIKLLENEFLFINPIVLSELYKGLIYQVQ